MTSQPYVDALNDEEYPSWSSNGESLAFTRALPQENLTQLCVMTHHHTDPKIEVLVSWSIADGSNSATIAYTSWSPDDSRIAFTYGTDTHRDLYVVNTSDNTISKLTNEPGELVTPVWITIASP